LRKSIAVSATTILLAACAAPQGQAPATYAEAPKPARCEPAPSEVVVKDITPGTGKAVGFRSAVNVWYTGWLYDGCAPDFKGKQFDSNAGKVPIGFMVGTGRVIPGWDEGLIGMKEKGKRLLIIPPNKGYGAREAPGGRIPPNSTLVFEVELMNVVAYAN